MKYLRYFEHHIYKIQVHYAYAITNINFYLLKILQVFCMYITGNLESVFPEEHRKEILRYTYYHQV